MKRIFPMVFIFFLAVFLLGCCNYSHEDFEFSLKYNSLLTSFNKGDTIFFLESKKADMDTITVDTIENSQSCGAGIIMSVPPHHDITVRIKHLPNNNWISGVEFIQNKYPKKLNQELITVGKVLSREESKQYYIIFQFRDFRGEIENVNSEISDTLFSNLGINKYWKVHTELPEKNQNEQSVNEIFWTVKYGLTAYKKRNGNFYVIKK